MNSQAFGKIWCRFFIGSVRSLWNTTWLRFYAYTTKYRCRLKVRRDTHRSPPWMACTNYKCANVQSYSTRGDTFWIDQYHFKLDSKLKTSVICTQISTLIRSNFQNFESFYSGFDKFYLEFNSHAFFFRPFYYG